MAYIVKSRNGGGRIDVCGEHLAKNIILYTLPLMASGALQVLFHAADSIVVGRYAEHGDTALAAVGSTGSIINTVVGFCAGLATGASVVISQRYGAHDNEGLSRAVHTTIAVTFILSLISTAAGLLIIDPMLRFMQTPQDVWDEARLYLVIYFSGISGILFYNMGSGILRAVGDSRRPLLFLIFSALLNTALDLLFLVLDVDSVFGAVA